MSRILLLSLLITNYLFASKCEHLLKEGDKYLEKVSLSKDASIVNYYSNAANAYFKRFEICIYQYESNTQNYRTNSAKEFTIKRVK